MWGEASTEKGGRGGTKAPQFRERLCLYIDSPHPKPLLLKGGPCVIFDNFYLEKYTFAAICEEEKVSCFSMKK